uniref:Trehalase n=1 Tax=Cyprinodon variegatus TaxID=28743 RepID=A0A3Q2DND3_CYPVA
FIGRKWDLFLNIIVGFLFIIFEWVALEIYCSGPILHQVQEAKLFDDDKYFVDMKLKSAPADVLAAFKLLSNESPNSSIPATKLKEFLDANFEKPGTEFETWMPTDWHEKPKFLSGIADEKLRMWGEEIHNLWKSLGRKIQNNVKDHPELYSQIYTPHPVVVPGGRFRELYYWDSYWVINGLLLSEMTETAHGMIQNFLFLVNRYGFVPNGGRIYYERRSQPPFLTLMVESYYEATKDQQFLREALPVLEKEYEFWMQNRSVALKESGLDHVLNRYIVEADLPRYELKQQLWMDLKAGAESGWDFTSRWFINSTGHNDGTLRETRTSQILPTDLNALLCRNERTLASFHRLLGNTESAALYDQAAARRTKAMEALLWDAERGAWFDYNLVTHSKHFEFYPSNLAPVWARCYSQPEMEEKAVKYLKGSGALDFPNGVPTSLRESGQQWDYPNAWPPLQHMLIEGLSKLSSEDAKNLASNLAQRWIKTNWLAYEKYKAMFEKVSMFSGCLFVFLGFGWTNGVALQLLDQYGATLTSGGRRVCVDLLLPLAVSIALMLH